MSDMLLLVVIICMVERGWQGEDGLCWLSWCLDGHVEKLENLHCFVRTHNLYCVLGFFICVSSNFISIY